MKLAIFDVDGTLLNSRDEIIHSMNSGMGAAGLPELETAHILSIVGLSLPIAVAQLLPGATPDLHDRVEAGYRAAYLASRSAGVLSPFYPGAMDCLDALTAQGVQIGIATGKTKRGLMALLEAYGITHRFVTIQTADGHPSKPHPAMLQSALREAGAQPSQAVMIGDTSFDIEMACSAGISGYGVSWGYHPVDTLHASGATMVAPDYPSLTAALLDWAVQEQPA